MNKGLISITLLVIALFGTIIVGGGGYAVYKVNQVQKESDRRVADLERKIEEVTVVPAIDKSVEIAEFATNTEEIIDEVEPVKTTIVERKMTPPPPKPVPVAQPAVAPVVRSASAEDYSYIVVTTLDNEIRNANNLLKAFPPIYELLDYERQRFIKIKTQTVYNLKGLGMTDDQINKETLIRLYDDYILWTKQAKDATKVYENSLGRMIDIYNLGKAGIVNESLTTMEESQIYLNNYYKKGELSVISKEIDGRYTYITDFITEIHAALLSKLDSQSRPTPPSIPSLNLPRITSTHCTVNFGSVSCDSIAY